MNDTTTVQPKTPERKKYVVFKANIMDDDGNKIFAGETVELGAATARRYNKLGFLRPHMEDEDNEDGDGDPGVEGKTAKLVGRVRPPAVPKATPGGTRAAAK